MNPFFRNVDRVRAITRASLTGRAEHLQSPSQASGAPTGIAQQPRGLTYPFNVTQISQQAFPIDFNRLYLFIQNNDPLGTAWLSFGTPAVLGTGIKLAAGGGGIMLDNNVPTAAIYLIGTIASNQNITIILG